MNTASQNPAGALPPASPPTATPDQAATVFAAYGAVLPVPVGANYSAPVAEAPISVEEAAAAAVLGAVRAQEADAMSLDLAATQTRAPILFDAEHVQEAIDAAVAQARADAQADLAERGEQLAVMTNAWRRQRAAVLRLCEGRRGDDLLLVSAVAVAVEYGTTALDGMPMTLAWTGHVRGPDARTTHKQVVVEGISSYGGRADLVITGEQRAALASLVDAEPRDVNAKCPTAGCGSRKDYDPSDTELSGWSRLEVACLGDGPRWYCSDKCVVDALARAGHEIAADQADDLDARYGAGVSDEYALQVAEASFEDERGDVDEVAGGAE
ncbi:hypothetical protein ACQ86D_34020 [Streptomyces galilaeus]